MAKLPNQIRILIIAKDVARFQKAAQFLSRRGWPSHAVGSVKQAVEQVVKFRPTFVLVSFSLPNGNITKLPNLLMQTFQVSTIVFGEAGDPMTTKRLNTCNLPHVFFGALSGPSIHMRIKNIIIEMQRDEKAGQQSGAAMQTQPAPGTDPSIAPQDAVDGFVPGPYEQMNQSAVGAEQVASRAAQPQVAGESYWGSKKNKETLHAKAGSSELAYAPQAAGAGFESPEHYNAQMEADANWQGAKKSPTSGGFESSRQEGAAAEGPAYYDVEGVNSGENSLGYNPPAQSADRTPAYSPQQNGYEVSLAPAHFNAQNPGGAQEPGYFNPQEESYADVGTETPAVYNPQLGHEPSATTRESYSSQLAGYAEGKTPEHFNPQTDDFAAFGEASESYNPQEGAEPSARRGELYNAQSLVASKTTEHFNPQAEQQKGWQAPEHFNPQTDDFADTDVLADELMASSVLDDLSEPESAVAAAPPPARAPEPGVAAAPQEEKMFSFSDEVADEYYDPTNACFDPVAMGLPTSSAPIEEVGAESAAEAMTAEPVAAVGYQMEYGDVHRKEKKIPYFEQEAAHSETAATTDAFVAAEDLVAPAEVDEDQPSDAVAASPAPKGAKKSATLQELSALVQQSLAEVCVPGAQIARKVQRAGTVGVVAVRASDQSGYLLIVWPEGSRVSKELMRTITTGVARKFQQGEFALDVDAQFEVPLNIDEFVPWAQQSADFIHLLQHGEDEIAVAYFKSESPLPTFEKIENVDDMSCVSFEHVVPEVVLNYTGYLNLKRNQKMLLYAKEGRMISQLQKERMISKKVPGLFIPDKDRDSFRAQAAAAFIQSKRARASSKRSA